MKKVFKKIRVAVLCGGPSSERGVSLKTGAQVVKHLSKDKYDVKTVEISRKQGWPITKRALRKSFDVAFIGMHGKFGEDGKVQSILELVGIPYTGSRVAASALSMNKVKSSEIVSRHGIKIPKYILVKSEPKTIDALHWEVLKNIGHPFVVKPNGSGSSIGVSIVRREKDLSKALRAAFKESREVLVQQHIRGREVTCGVMGNSGKTNLTALPVVEIIPSNEFFDYEAKYNSSATKEICPALIEKNITQKIQGAAKKIHAVLGCDGLTRSDFILSPGGEIYFLEINTIPGLTEASLCPKEAKAAGMSFSEFLEKQVDLAMFKTRRG